MIREATLTDRSTFLLLWSEHMVEQEKEGSHLLASTHNLYKQLETFEGYVNGCIDGACIFYEVNDKPIALVLAGAYPNPDEWDTNLGRISTVWGVYVQPPYRGQGIGVKLFQRCLEIALELGFESVETYVRINNAHGQRVAKAFGTTPYLQQHLVSLKDPEVLQNSEAREALGREVSNGS